MNRVETIQRQIENLSPAELVAFRSWYAMFDAVAWDQQFEDDVRAGRLDTFGDRALQSHRAGQSKKV